MNVTGNGTGTGGQVVGQGNGNNTTTGSVTVPYNQVYSNYANSAYAAANNGGYPFGLQGVIKQYFTSLAPSS